MHYSTVFPVPWHFWSGALQQIARLACGTSRRLGRRSLGQRACDSRTKTSPSCGKLCLSLAGQSCGNCVLTLASAISRLFHARVRRFCNRYLQVLEEQFSTTWICQARCNIFPLQVEFCSILICWGVPCIDWGPQCVPNVYTLGSPMTFGIPDQAADVHKGDPGIIWDSDVGMAPCIQLGRSSNSNAAR